MRLLYVDRPGCYHMSEIMPAVSAVYQMEQEFFPYLYVDFIDDDGKGEGVILQTKHGDFRKKIAFKSENDVKELRAFVWEHLKQDYKIKDITENGYLTSFAETGKNKVIQGWNPDFLHGCKKCFNDIVSKPEKDNIKGYKHQVYNVRTKPKLNKELCNKIRNIDCDTKFRGQQNIICKKENAYLCGLKYPNEDNPVADKMSEGFGTKNNWLMKIIIFCIVTCILFK